MIRLRVNKNDERIPVVTTIFPDGTSQVWKIPQFENIKITDKIVIEWDPLGSERHNADGVVHPCMNESECMQIFQLLDLLTQFTNPKNIKLKVSYLPYARQDKEYGNDKTFALKTFLKILNIFKVDLYCLDMHANYFNDGNSMWDLVKIPDIEVKNYIPKFYIKEGVIIAPDEGAYHRYIHKYPNHMEEMCKKKRDPLTGKIIELEVPTLLGWYRSVAIVDDICDGGSTFIEIAKNLKKQGIKFIKLYVTHGLFSKGKQVLYDAGIDEIETYDYEKFFNGEDE